VNLLTDIDRLRDECEVAMERAKDAEARMSGMKLVIDAQAEKIKRLRKALSDHIGNIRVARVERGEVAK
jgi:hypothetical protein